MLDRMDPRVATVWALGAVIAGGCRFDPHGTGSDDGDESGDSETPEDGDEIDPSDASEDGEDTADGGSGSADDSGTPPECQADDDCSGSTPYCEGGECVDCTGLDLETCADKDPATPACRSSDGVCVQCTASEAMACSGLNPVCDSNNECVGCTRHEQCAVACNLETGGCMPENVVFIVDRGTCSPGTEDGSQDQPFCTVSAAVNAVDVGTEGTIFVQGGAGTYRETVTINGNRTVAMLGRGDPAISFGGDNVLQTRTGTRVYLSAINIGETAAQFGIDCQFGTVWMDATIVHANSNNGINAASCDIHLRDSVVENNSVHGISANQGTLTAERTRIDGNAGIGLTVRGTTVTLEHVRIRDNAVGGVVLDGGAIMQMRTGIIARNGDDFLASRALDAVDGSFGLVYVTVAANDGSDGSKSIGCEAGGMGSIRNSIIVAEEVASVTCSDLIVQDSAVQDPDLRVGNTDVGSWNSEWFVDVAGGDFHLGNAQADFAGIARWQEADPAVDIDGDPRPTTEGASDWPGADAPR